MFFFYFMLRRFLPGQPNHTPSLLIDLTTCWDTNPNDILCLQWLYIRLGYALYQLNAVAWKPVSAFQSTELLSILLMLVTLLIMATSCEGLTITSSVRIIVALDQMRACIGMTALVKALIIEPTKTLAAQAGFFTFMLAHNFYETWIALKTEYTDKFFVVTQTSKLFETLAWSFVALSIVQLAVYYWQVYIWCAQPVVLHKADHPAKKVE